jgi:ABC-2 type transport system permease protein
MTQSDLAAGIPATAIPRTGRSAATVIARLTARKAVRSGVVWGYIFGALIASSAVSYTRIYTTQAARDALAAAYGANKATSALFGPAPRLQTVAGFTAFKIGMTLMLLGAVWGLLTSTRLLRGEAAAGSSCWRAGPPAAAPPPRRWPGSGPAPARCGRSPRSSPSGSASTRA